MQWSDLLLRLRPLVVWRRVEQELDEELRFHIEMQLAPEIPRERTVLCTTTILLPSAQTIKARRGVRPALQF